MGIRQGLLLKENTRAWLAAGATVIVSFAMTLAGRFSGTSPSLAENLVVVLATFLLAYAVSTVVVFAVAPRWVIEEWAATQKSSWVGRYVFMSQPGGGLALYFSVTALVVAFTVLPNPERVSDFLPAWLVVALTVVMVLSAWLSISITQALDYLASHKRLGPNALLIPGTPSPGFHDYLYFAVAITATFGTTDVEIRSTPLRRRVTTHTVIAFIFNTMILAAVVGVLINNLP